MIDFYNPKGKEKKKRLGDIDIRGEVAEMFHKDMTSAWFLFRRARRNENGVPVKHPYTKENRNAEGPVDIGQEDSNDKGYLYDDHIVKGYFNHSQAYAIYERTRKAGDITTEYRTIYFEWNFLDPKGDKQFEIPDKFDRVILVESDMEGNILSPIKTRQKFGILSVDPYRLDSSGRIEYHRVRVIAAPDESFLV